MTRVLTTLGRIRRLVAEAAGVSAPPDPATVLAELFDLLPEWLTEHVTDNGDASSMAFDVSLDDVRSELHVRPEDGVSEITAVHDDIARVLEAEDFRYDKTVHAMATYDMWHREGVTLFVSVMGSYTRPQRHAGQSNTGVVVVISASNT